MNYNPFLNKSSNKRLKFKNNNQYRPSSNKKNGKIFLVSSIFSIAILTTFVSLLADSSQSVSAENSTSSTMTAQVTKLDLPEIGYQSKVLSEAVVYTEPKTNTEVNTQNIAKTKTIEVSKVTSEKTVTEEVVKVAPVKKEEIKTALIEEHAITTLKSDITIIPSSPEQEVTTAETTVSKNIVVKKGDTLSAIFKRHSLSSSDLYKIIKSGKEAKKLTRIKPGQTFTITLSNEDELTSLKFDISKEQTLVVNRKNDQFVPHIETRDIDIVQQFSSGTINNSLFSAGQKAGLDSSMIMKLAHIFGWDIDFALDIRKGDSFAVLYEEKFIDGKKISNGNILSAEFVNNGKVFKAIRYTDDSGHTDYYSEEGLSMRKAFLRSPVEFSRISSRFSSGRKHPVLNRIRAHKGVDYAASRGTPIKAVGDGKVIFKGNKGGYGRVVILQHGSKYTTLYAHLNSYNKKLRNGSRVKQGQTIGYVGSSGLATGPHLHYEFRVSGVHRNPLTVSLPSAAPIARKYKNDFKAAAETMISQLKLRKQETIALKEQ